MMLSCAPACACQPPDWSSACCAANAALRQQLRAAPLQPVVVRNSSIMPLTSRVLRERCGGDVAVPLAVSDGGGFSGTLIDAISFDVDLSDFLDRFDSAAASLAQQAAPSDAALSSRYYLAQCAITAPGDEAPLRALSPLVLQHGVVRTVLACFGASEQRVDSNLWMSLGAVTTTLAHFDENHGLLCVVSGRKTVRLGSPLRTRLYAPHSVASESANHSRLANDDDCFEVSVDLGPGDCLFIPEGTWHSVVTLPCTVAVNFWFPGRVDALLRSEPALVQLLCRRVLREHTHAHMKRLAAALDAAPVAVPADAVVPQFFAADEHLRARIVRSADKHALDALLAGAAHCDAAAFARAFGAELSPLVAKCLVDALERVGDAVDNGALRGFVERLGSGDALAGEKRLLMCATALYDQVLLESVMREEFGVGV